MPNKFLETYRQSLREQGVEDPRDDLIVMRDFLLPLAQQNPELYSAYPDFEAEIRPIRDMEGPGTVRGIVNTAKSAYDQSLQSKNVIGGIDDTDAQDIATIEKRIRERPSSRAWEDWRRTEGKEAAAVFLRDPFEITANIIASGFAGSLPALAGGLGGGAVGAGIGTSIGGPPGALIGGTIGAAAGTGAGSLAVEYGGKYLEVLREEGADLADPESILRVLEDPEVRARARSLAYRRGVPVAMFDAASAGIAGKLAKGFRAASTAGKVGRVAAEGAAGGTLGALGEAAGAVAAGDPVSPGAMFEEFVGDVIPQLGQAAGAALRNRIAAPTDIAPPPLPPITGVPAAPTAPVTPLPAAPIVAPPTTARRSNADILAAVDAMDDATAAARLLELQSIPVPDGETEVELQVLLARAPSFSPATPKVAPATQEVAQPVLPVVAPVETPAEVAAPGIAVAPAPTGVAPAIANLAEPVVPPTPVAAPAPEETITPVPPKEAAPAVAAQPDLPKPSEIPPVVASTTATPEEHAAAVAVEPVEPVVTPLLTVELRSRPELPELAGRMVQLEALTDGGERVVAEIDAAQAWSDTQKQIGIYRRLLDCLKGAA